MNSGNRVTIVLATLLGAFTAADAGRVGEDGTGAMWIAPELMDAVAPHMQPGEIGCTREVVAQVTDLAAAGRLTFEWHPATGELSFDADQVMPRVALPEDWVPESQVLTLAQACGSR